VKWGRPQPCIPSRFLLEMRGDDERAKKAEAAAKALFFPEARSTHAEPRGQATSDAKKSRKRAQRKAETRGGKAGRRANGRGSKAPTTPSSRRKTGG
jgi:hypothetical protein